MIIVSQNKESIINFNNITQIYTTFSEDDDYVWIRVETVNSLYEDLGFYKTKTRAKEVLKEIIKKYEKSMCSLGKQIMSFEYIYVYEMPKE